MHEQYNITILTDKTSWMNKFNLILKTELERLGHKVVLIDSKNNLIKGDIAFFLSCFEIVSDEYLKLNKNNIVVHASDLPEGKGWSPTSWQILEGKNEIPVTLFEATNSVDAGDYYIKDKLILNGTELIEEWQEKLGLKIVEMALKYVINYTELLPVKQIGTESFYKKRRPEDSKLDIDKTIREQFNLLRIVDNEKYPAYFSINGQDYKISINPLGGGERTNLNTLFIIDLSCKKLINLLRIFCALNL